MKTLLLAHLGATLLMLGVILVIQVVHYPLFDRVGAAGFAAYEAAHTRLITYVVLLPMMIELITGILLVRYGPPLVPGWMVWAGLGLLGVIWLSTALLQVPLHGLLAKGFDAGAHRRLVATNGIRTAAWMLRAALVLAMTAPLLRTS